MHCLCVKGFSLFGSFQMPCTWGKCHWINFVVLFYELSLSCGCWYVGCKIIHASSLCEKLLKGIDVYVSRRPLFAGKLAAIVVIVKGCPYPPARIFKDFKYFTVAIVQVLVLDRFCKRKMTFSESPSTSRSNALLSNFRFSMWNIFREIVSQTQEERCIVFRANNFIADPSIFHFDNKSYII